MYQICVSGAARGNSVEEGRILAGELGKAIAEAGHVLMTGATIGLPNYTAEAYKKAGGRMSVGISPASTKIEHVMKYRLPIAAYDTIIFSGLHYVGRDNLLITSSDAVISLGGRIGTLHEFTIAIETDTPIGILEGAGGVSDEIKTLVSLAKPIRENSVIIFEKSADALIKEVATYLDKEHSKYKAIYE